MRNLRPPQHLKSFNNFELLFNEVSEWREAEGTRQGKKELVVRLGRGKRDE